MGFSSYPGSAQYSLCMVQEILGGGSLLIKRQEGWPKMVKGMMKGERSMAWRYPGISGRDTQVGNEGKSMREMKKRK